MRQANYLAGLEFPYPENGSHLEICRTLKRWAKYQPTLDGFPWRMAPHLYDSLTKANPDFAYAELTLFCKGEAARRALAPTMAGYQRRILAGIIKHHPQIGGIFYEHLRYWVTAYLIRRRLTEWPECEGISPFRYGNHAVTPQELEANRRDLLAAIAEATRWYERTLAKIGNSDSLDGRASGHELHHWVGGAEMPSVVRVPVTAEKENGVYLISPDMEEAKPILDSGWDLPEYPVEEDELALEPLMMPAPMPDTPRTTSPEPRQEQTPSAIPTLPEIAAARMLQSGIIVTTGSLSEKMTPAERELTNYLVAYKNPVRKSPFSYLEIGRLLGCSHETIRRRQRALEQKHPGLKRVIAAVRSLNGRGSPVGPAVTRHDIDAMADSH